MIADKEVGELWYWAAGQRDDGVRPYSKVRALIRKLVEERTEKLIYLCLGTNTISTCARLRHDHNIEARRDFGIPLESWK